MAAITVLSGGPFAAGSTLTYKALIQDGFGNPVPSQNLTSLTLSMVETDTGIIINNINAINILNQDRGAVDASGNLTVTLQPADTAFATMLQINMYSLILDFVYNGGTGRHQVNFKLQQLAGP